MMQPKQGISQAGGYQWLGHTCHKYASQISTFESLALLSGQDLSAALSDTERAPSPLKSFVSPRLCCGLMVMQEGAGHSCATARDG